jgi:tetratricopeptide (TPR) repeat protein
MCALGLPPEKLTPADNLRETLRQCELKTVALKGSGAEAIGLLKLMDKAQSLFDQLETKGIDLRAERSRWETIERQLCSRAALLVREIQTAGGLAQLRETTEPTPDRWWWFLDEEVRHRRQQAFKRTAVRGIAGLLILVIAGLLYQHFLAPDPLTKHALLLTERAEQAIQEGDLEEAVAEYEALRELTPDDLEVFLHLGVLYETLERDTDAAQAYARAHALLDSQEDLFLRWGMIYLDVGQWESARARAEAALVLNPESAQGYFILASSYEAQGQITEAVDALQQAAELAYAQGDDTLYVLIKLRLGTLMGGSGKVDPLKQISPDSKT